MLAHGGNEIPGHGPLARNASDNDIAQTVALFRQPEELLVSAFWHMRQTRGSCCTAAEWGYDAVQRNRIMMHINAGHQPDQAFTHVFHGCQANMLLGRRCFSGLPEGSTGDDARVHAIVAAAVDRLRRLLFVGLTSEWWLSICLWNWLRTGHRYVTKMQLKNCRPTAVDTTATAAGAQAAEMARSTADAPRLAYFGTSSREWNVSRMPSDPVDQAVYAAATARFWSDVAAANVSCATCPLLSVESWGCRQSWRALPQVKASLAWTRLAASPLLQNASFQRAAAAVCHASRRLLEHGDGESRAAEAAVGAEAEALAGSNTTHATHAPTSTSTTRLASAHSSAALVPGITAVPSVHSSVNVVPGATDPVSSGSRSSCLLPRASILIYVWTPADFSPWRQMMRPHLSRLTSGMASEVRFALLLANDTNTTSMHAELAAEQGVHGDLTVLTSADRGFQPSGRKYWLALAWTVRFRPHVDFVFKQEHDAIVDWRRAWPRMLMGSSAGGDTHGDTVHREEAKGRERYLGRLCDPLVCTPMRRYLGPNGRCAAGMVSGVSIGLARWLVSAIELDGCNVETGCGPCTPSGRECGRRWRLGRKAAGRWATRWLAVQVEDVQLCEWAHAYDAHQPRTHAASDSLLDRSGIVSNASDRFWVHRLKKAEDFEKCMRDAALPRGCAHKDGVPSCHYCTALRLELRDETPRC